MSTIYWIGGVLAFVALTPAASAQATIPVDAGTFILTQGGRVIGTEAFTIGRTSTPQGGFVLTGTRSGGGRVTNSSLATDSLGTPITYQHAGRGGDASERLVNGKLEPGRFTLAGTLGRGSSSQEYILRPGMLLLEDETVYQLFLVALGAVPRQLSSISTYRRAIVEEPVALLGPDTVRINGESIPATHASIGAGMWQREIWVDAQKRLLKVLIPRSQVTALRDKPPL